MAEPSANRGAEVDPVFESDGRRGFLLGRNFEIRLGEPGHWPLHQAGDAVSSFHCRFRRAARNRRRVVLAGGLDSMDFRALHRRDDRGDALHQNLALSGHFAFAPPPAPPRIGFWAVLREARSEYAQALVVAFLLINGPERWSLDALFRRAAEEGGSQKAGARFRQQLDASI